MPRKKKEEGKTHYDFVDHLKSSFYDVGGRTKLEVKLRRLTSGLLKNWLN